MRPPPRHLALVALVALSSLISCTDRAPSIPSASPPPSSPRDAGADAASEAGALATDDIEGETIEDAKELPPLADDETAPPDYSDDEDPSATPAKIDACAPSHKHVIAAEEAILAVPHRRPASSSRPPWDHKTPPARLDLVKGRFGLTAPELAIIARQGFVVPARLSFSSYAIAYHEIYQSELPLYISADSIFHTVFATNDEIMETLEVRRLAPLLGNTLRKLHEALPAAAPGYPPDIAADLDLYLTVARSLLAGSYVNGVTDTRGPATPEARSLIAAAMKAEAMETVEIFGRPRVIDFSQYKPRGHYTKGRTIARYFRAAMWLSRLEWNLVSRSCRSSQPGFTPDPTETPREATVALALADLADRCGAMKDIDLLDTAWSLLAGPREDVPLQKLAELRKAAGIGALTVPDAADKLRAAIGQRYPRTARLHYMPQGSTDLPVIATLLGPRVVIDAFATRPLVHDETPDRYDLGVADMAYAFGHDRAQRYLAADLARYPTLPAQLAKARSIASTPSTGKDLYGAWLGAVRALAERPPGALPSFMSTEAFADMRLNSFVSAYGQIKHNYVLMAGQPYDEGACAVPDGYVEPALGVYQALAAYADRGRMAMAALDPKGALGSAAYFTRLGKLMRVLGAISEAELAGEPLSKAALDFLSMVVEIHGVDIGTGFNTTYNGWYFDLFLERPYQTTSPPPGRLDHPALKSAAFIADYYTSSNTQKVAYAGAAAPRLGIFVVDTGGGPRVVVGPVAHAYEHHGPLSARVTDADALKLGALVEPWSESYVTPAPPEIPLSVDMELKDDGAIDEVKDKRSKPVNVLVESSRALGPVTVDLLDHNRRKVASLTRSVGVGKTTFAFPSHPQRVLDGTRAFEMMKIRAGDFQVWFDLLNYPFPVTLGGMAPPAKAP